MSRNFIPHNQSLSNIETRLRSIGEFYMWIDLDEEVIKPPVVRIREKMYYRFMNFFYLPQPPESLSTEKVIEICDLRLEHINKLVNLKHNSRIVTAIANYLLSIFPTISSPATKMKALDFGCGSGLSLQLLNKHFPQLETLGVDISKKAIQCSQMQGLNTVLIKPNEPLPFEAASFDLIFAIFVMHFKIDIVTLAELKRVLHPGGKYVFNLYQRQIDGVEQELTAIAFQWNQINRTYIFSSSNSNPGNSVLNPQDEQILAEAQQDVSVANNMITWSGFFLAFIASAVAIAGFFGIHEFRRIQHLRNDLDKERGEVITLKAQVREELNNLAKHFESESQTFMGVSYNLGAANDAYKLGDNKRAIKYYLAVLKLQPKNVRVMERLGRAYSNLNEMQRSIDCLQKALEIDPSYEPSLRSLALCYRYTDKDKAIEKLKLALEKNPSDYEALDFLGLIYRDYGQIDDAIAAHEQALKIKKRPETQFYLSLLYSKKGKTKSAKRMSLNAEADLDTNDPDEELRPVWQIVIRAGVLILEDKEDEAYKLIASLTEYITTQRIGDAVTGHVKFLLASTGHDAWKQKFISVLKAN